jgi:hypothetical protein
MPTNVSKKIVERAARGEVAVVVPRGGKPSRVFGIEEYLKMRNLPRKVKPWTHRKREEIVPDPLGAVEGTVLMPVVRANIYD